MLSVPALVRDHGPYVWRSLRYLGVSESDLPDVCQEVFLVVVQKMSALESVEHTGVQGVLYGICLRKAMHYRRTAARRRVFPVGDPPEIAGDESADERIVRRDARELGLWLLGQMDDDQREVFVLHEIERLPMKEVVALVGCPLQTGYSRLRLARAKVLNARQWARARGLM